MRAVPDAPPRLAYQQRADLARAEDARYDSWSAVTGNGRVLLIFVGVGLALWTRSRGGDQPVSFYWALAGLFVGSLIAQDWADRRRDQARLRVLHYERAMDRLAGLWKGFTQKGLRFDTPNHPYARDLDVIGSGSLFQVIDTTRTLRGESTLAAWLLAPSPLAAIEGRRASARALSQDLDARERLAIAGLDKEVSRIDEEPLLSWVDGPEIFTASPIIILAARILPVVTISTYLIAREGLLPFQLLWGLLVGHLLLAARTRKEVERIGSVAERTEAMLNRLLPVFEASLLMSTPTPHLKELVASLTGAVEATRSLKRRVAVFQSRANLIVAVLSPLLLWDIHAAVLLRAWRTQYGARLRSWFEALGAVEALSAMGTYVFEHQEDAWPELSEGAPVFEAKGLGHPLLGADKCVRNDVKLQGRGTGLIVTGSNMSGKSTLLRAMGLNTVLALAGLPVRSVSMRVSVIQIATTMRVSDSLQEGASFFLAEVQRLKSVVDLAHGQLPVLFLLDEILAGTNTRERSLGARGVIAHLLDVGAFGVVSTHDLSLARLGDHFRERIEYAHFTDQVTGDQMTFDYLLKPGVVQTSNALRLMRAVGLNVEVPED
jgi:hypothetical protein